MTPDADFDIVIAGGGLVGASLAVALAGTPVRIAVIEAVSRGDAAQPSFDERMTALAPTTRRVFQALGLWPAIAAEAAPIRSIHVSDRGRFGFTRMSAAEENLDALGHVVPNRRLGAVLPPAMDRQANVTQFCPAAVDEVEVGADGVRLTIGRDDAPAETLDARLLVGADGARSGVREALGLTARWHPYGQTAVIANVVPERDPAGAAFERFTDEGPLAVLPAGQGRCAVIWTVGEERAEAVMALSDEAFLDALQSRFGHRLGRFVKTGARSAYPLGAMRVPRVTAERGVVVGNAAHTLHPVAGQGFNLAMRDVATLAELVHEAVRAGQDPGSGALLGRYAVARRGDYRRVMGFTHSLVQLFSNDLPGVRGLRNAGLVAMDLLPGIKRAFLRNAMGRSGWLPRLARGRPLIATEEASR